MILKKIIFFVCVFLFNNSFAQTQFYKEYSSPYQQNNFRFIAVKDTSIYGYLDQNTSVIINKNGQVSSSKRYQYNFANGYYTGNVSISDTTTMFYGASPLSSNVPFISVYNNKGFFKYNKTYTISGLSIIKNVLKTDNNLYHVIMPQPYNLNFQIMKTDLSGNYKSITKILTSHDNNPIADSDPRLINVNSNQFILSYTYFDSLYFNRNIGIVALDSNLNILWQKSVGDHFDEIPKFINKTDNNNIYISGITNSYGVGQYDVFVLKFDSAGTIKWFNTFGTIKSDDIAGATVDSANNIVLCGNTNYFNNLSRGTFLKINSSGNLLFSKYYDPLTTSKTHRFQDVAILSDKTIALTGQIFNTTTSLYLLNYFKLASFNNGCVLKDAAFAQKTYTPTISQSKFNKTTGTTPTISSVTNPTLSAFTFSNSATSCAQSCSVIADFIVNKVNYCNGDTIQLINKSFNASSYVWKINNSLYSSSTNTSIVTNTTIANYTITLLSYGVCTDSTSLVIHKLNNSVASFTKSNKNLYAIFNNTSLYEASYKWYFGDGSTSVAYSPSHVYDTLKSYNVCLKVSNACNRDSICQLLVAEDHLQTSFYSFYQGSNDHDEMGYGIAQSRNGDIMVTGLANAYSASGDKGFKMVIDKTNGDSKYQAIDSYNGATVYHNVISTHDNGFIYTAEINLDNDIITKKDSIDNRLWTYKMPLKKISSIIEAKDSSIYVCGYNLSNCCIVKLNSIGKILWYKVFSGGKNGMSIIETSDRNILVTGQYVANVSAYLLKINPNGQVIWSKYYSAAQTFNSLSVSETNDHHYLLTGRVFLTSPYADSWAAKLDTSGTPVWSKSYHAAYVSLSQGNGFYENQYGQYFLSLSATSSYSNLLLRLDNSGNVKWFRSYALSPTYPSSFLYKSILTHDGGIALCGNTTYNPNPNKDIYVFKIDTAGYNGGCLIDQMTYTVSNFPMTANTNLFESVASTSYGQIPINNSFWGTNLYAFTDSTQCNSSNIITGINSMESYSSYSSVNINPNPANKNIRISSESYINDIVIFDALGKKVYQISNLNDLYINIDLSNYHTGLYYIKISGGDFSNVRKIIKSE